MSSVGSFVTFILLALLLTATLKKFKLLIFHISFMLHAIFTPTDSPPPPPPVVVKLINIPSGRQALWGRVSGGGSGALSEIRACGMRNGRLGFFTGINIASSSTFENFGPPLRRQRRNNNGNFRQ